MTDQSMMRMNLGIDSVAASKGGVQLGKLNTNNEEDLDLSLSTEVENSMNLKESLESWDLDPKEIIMEKELGKGAFGVVYLGKLRGQTVAIKKLNKQNLEEKNLTSFKTEIEIMSKLRHPNVILFMGACTQQGNLMIVLEYMPRGNLKSLLQKQDLPFKTKMSFAKQISVAMSWLHSNNPPFIHRDLKTSNILVSKNDVVKIADFGLSFIKKDNEEGNFGLVGTPLWMAPEVLAKKPYNEKADLYSFGMVIWEMITRKTPFSNIHTVEELTEAVVTKEERPVIPEGTPPNLKRIIQKVWSTDPAKRPGFSDITGLFDLITCGALINLGPVEDKNGLKLWKTNFMKNDVLRDTVTFDEFCTSFCEAGSLSYDEEDITFKCLKSVLSRDEKTVTIEDYGILLQRFGPLDNHEEFLARIVNLLKKSWFHGEISAEQSEKIVMNSTKNGTFLVRFSSDPGSFAITSKSQNGNLKHYRIYHKAGLDYLIGQIECKSLDDIIKKYYKELGLKYPAAGSPYENLFNTEKKKKQSQMSSGYQVFN